MNILEFILHCVWIIGVIFILRNYIIYFMTPNQNKDLFDNMNKLDKKKN